MDETAENTERPDFSNSAYLFPPIHPEGKKFGFAALALASALAVGSAWCHALWLLVGPAFLLAYGVFLFFRNPKRYPPEDPAALLSPADGRVCLIEEVPLPEELYADGGTRPSLQQDEKVWRVSVFMSVFNVHVNRMPFAGTVLRKAYVPGKFLNASLDKASKDNERCAYLVKTESGTEYGVVQIAGLVARRIVPLVKEGESRARAEVFGLIRFGSRLDVYLPKGVKPLVQIGQIMVSGETVLGKVLV